VTRPVDWAPLAESDPLAGDPEEIEKEAALLRTMAAEMAWQVRTLKGMGTDTNLSGDSIVALKASATDVAAKLEKVIHRYSEAARCLSGWAPELEEFQRKSAALLVQAQEVERAAGRDIHDGLLDPVQAAYRQLSTGGGSTAPPELAVLTKQLHALLEEAEARGRFWAHQIAVAIDDQLTDHWLDHLHGWVKNHKEQLESYTRRLGWVATVAAVGALMVPGLNVAVLGLGAFGTLGALDAVAIGTTGTLLATHGLMAAEGQGSWLEVGIDAAALLSFGYGLRVSSGVGKAAEITKEAGAEAAGKEAAERYATMTREQLTQKLESTTDMAERRGIKVALRHVNVDATQFGDTAAQAAREAPEAEAGLGERLLAGSNENADAVKGAKQILAEHPGDKAVQDAAAHVRRLAAKGQRNYLVATGVDASDKALNRYWRGSYRGFKDHATHGIGWLQ
jgi:hypothetical protein